MSSKLFQLNTDVTAHRLNTSGNETYTAPVGSVTKSARRATASARSGNVTTSLGVRVCILFLHGVLSMGLGLTLFYLAASMTNILFEKLAVVIAILLCAAALILAAIADWFVAFSEGIKHVHRLIFFLLAGTAFVLAGVFLGAYPTASMQWLIVFASVHALVFGAFAIVFAWRAEYLKLESRTIYFLGSVSILFSGFMGGFVEVLGNRSSAVILGAYLCFVGAKMIFLAWNSYRSAAMADQFWLDGAR